METLKNLLDCLSKELSQPYMERHIRKSRPIDELEQAIIEISKRERELKAAIGIAYHLLETNEYLSEQLSDYKDKLKLSESVISHRWFV